MESPFLIYLSLQAAVKFFAVAVGLFGRHELNFHVGPENPSLVATEFQWELRKRTVPKVFLK